MQHPRKGRDRGPSVVLIDHAQGCPPNKAAKGISIPGAEFAASPALTARKAVQEGRLGTIVSVSVLAMFLKSDAYFDVAWRRSPGGGPVLINLTNSRDRPPPLRLRRAGKHSGRDLKCRARLSRRGFS